MFKISKKIQFSSNENRMSSIANTEIARDLYNSAKYSNLKFLLEKRFAWMNNFINDEDNGIEVGSGAGFTKNFILNKNFKLTDIGSDKHLDFKNIDAQNTGFEEESFDYVIASNMIHHIPFPIKFFREINKILKKNGKLIIFEAYCSIFLQLATIIMKHEGFDFTKNVWDENDPKSDEKNAWAGNIAVPNLLFDDKKSFKKKMGNYFSIEYEEITEFLIFLNSGGVTSKTFHIPLPFFILKFINFLDKVLVKILPNIFGLGRRIVLRKLN